MVMIVPSFCGAQMFSDDEYDDDEHSDYDDEYDDDYSDYDEDCDLGNAGVYVLRYPNNTFYVGKSSNIQERISQHRRERGHFTVLRPETEGSTSDLESWERNETLHRMLQHGIKNVRGWMFTKAKLTRTEYNAKRQIFEKYDLCRICGRDNHFSSRCYARSMAPWLKEN